MLAAACLLGSVGLHAQYAIGGGEVVKLYRKHCVSCHGKELEGGIGGSLVSMKEWKPAYDAEFAEIIRNGLPDLGMAAYGTVLSEKEIRSLVIYIREQFLLKNKEAIREGASPRGGVFRSEEASFRLEEVLEYPGILWSVAWLPDGDRLVAAFDGELVRIPAGGGEAKVITGTPEVWRHGQGGLLEVAVHPEYPEEPWIYLAFSAASGERAGRKVGMTRIVRGQLDGDRWVKQERIYEAPKATHLPTAYHFGTRLVLTEDGSLYFAIGDRGRKAMAQDLSKPNGKMHRLRWDGSIPGDNPFVERSDALPTLWSYGHRNPQGIDQHPGTGEIWLTEHGPRGGDELNRVQRGANYGWPEVTHGMNYNGLPITEFTEKPGMVSPVVHWTPSLAVCGMAFYTGEAFAGWEGDLLVTGLAAQELRRLVLEDGEVVHQEVLIKDQGRVRDVGIGPDGIPEILIMETDRKTGRLMQLQPVTQ